MPPAAAFGQVKKLFEQTTKQFKPRKQLLPYYLVGEVTVISVDMAPVNSS